MSEPERRADVVDRIVDLADEFGFGLLGWVVLPNHYHALMTVPDTSSLSRLVGRLHGSTSRAWNIEDRADGRKCWYRYSDRTIRTDRHFYTALNYIHLNPVKHGVATTPFDWTASSIHWYTEHRGVAWLDDYFTTHPVRQMGTGWDEL